MEKQEKNFRHKILDPIINKYPTDLLLIKNNNNVNIYDNAYKVIVIMNSTINNIYISDNVYMIVMIDVNLNLSIPFKFKTFGKLTHVFLKNIQTLNSIQHNFFELYYLGNLYSLYINNVSNMDNILLTTNEQIVKYNQQKILHTNIYKIKKFDNMIMIGGFDKLRMFDIKPLDKKIFFLEDYHTNYKLCTINVNEYTPIEFLSFLYKFTHNSAFIFERLSTIDMQQKYEDNTNPNKLPINIIGVSKWFNDLQHVYNVDNRMIDKYRKLHVLTHSFVSNKLSSIDKFKFFDSFKKIFDRYELFIDFIFYELGDLSQNISQSYYSDYIKHKWMIYCYESLEMFKDKYVSYFDYLKTLSMSDFNFDKNINIMEMFLGPMAFIVDANMLNIILNTQYKLYVVNIGGKHADNICEFFKYIFTYNFQQLFDYDNIETENLRSCVNFPKNMFKHFDL